MTSKPKVTDVGNHELSQAVQESIGLKNAGLAPVADQSRITSIDVLRGFALLGILVMNIQSFALVDAKYMNPTAGGEVSGVSYACWLFAHLFFDSKFMAIFSVLFGAGIVLMWERAKANNSSFTSLHYRRMIWLFLIGLAHAHLFWVGDILVPYAMCGMLVYWLCGLRPRWLITIGLSLISVATLLTVLAGASIGYMDEPSLADLRIEWSPNAERIETNLAIYRGSWLEQMPHRIEGAFFMETFVFLYMFVWRISGLMLIGMAMFKLGVFNATRSFKFYSVGAIVGMSVGVPLVLGGVYFNEINEWRLESSFFFGSIFNYWGSMFVAFAYVCLLMLACQRGIFARLQQSLAAVGKMALTNYLLHTIICTTIFYGHGLGWFGYCSRLQLMGVVVAVWIAQLVLSPVWLKFFMYGPFEWLWRSLSYWKLQSLVRVAK